jgi:epoxyqueuosine reductase
MLLFQVSLKKGDFGEKCSIFTDLPGSGYDARVFQRTVMQAATVKQRALALGFSKVGIVAAVPGPETARLHQWLGQGNHGTLDWMGHPNRQDIQRVLPGVRSLVCVALNYYTPHAHSGDRHHGKISRYGWGRDYHRVLGRKLKALGRWLEAQGEGIQARWYVDTGPIMEKAWAERAGIGWIGKHSNVITREFGSWVFLGEVLTNLELEPDRPHAEHCGTCTRCITACPTGAITQPFVVDARRCLAYHTIENREPALPPAIAAQMQQWVAGCDICQDVCPWNQRFAQPTTEPDFQPYAHHRAPLLAELAQMTEAEWESRTRGSALRRIKRSQWQRNARAALGTTTVEHPDTAPEPLPAAAERPQSPLESSQDSFL